MSLTADVLILLAAGVPLAVALRVMYAGRNRKKDPGTPGWRVVTHQFGGEQRTKAMSKEHALSLASRLIYGAVKVVRLDNDADGTTMTLDEIRAHMQHDTPDA